MRFRAKKYLVLLLKKDFKKWALVATNPVLYITVRRKKIKSVQSATKFEEPGDFVDFNSHRILRTLRTLSKPGH